MLLLIFLFTALQLHLGNPINRYMHIEVESNAVLIIIHWFIMLASFLCVLYILGRGIML